MIVSNLETAIVVASICIASAHVIVKALDVVESLVMRKMHNANDYFRDTIHKLHDRVEGIEGKIENALGIGSNPKA